MYGRKVKSISQCVVIVYVNKVNAGDESQN
jgi:hypothetical protein